MSKRGVYGLTILSFLLLLLLPGPATSELGGAPLSSEGYLLLGGTACLAVLVLLIAPARQLSAWVPAVLALLALLKVGVGFSVPPVGWQGSYYADADPGALRSFKSGLLTRPHRIDRRIEFESVRFGLHFLNDPFRYGVPYSRLPRDHEFALKVDWIGYCHLEQATVVEFGARARGSLVVLIDGKESFQVGTPGGSWSVERELGAGTHQVRLSYIKPALTDPLVSFGARANGRELAFAPRRSGARLVPVSLQAGRAVTVLVWLAALLLAVSVGWSYGPIGAALERAWSMPGRVTVVGGFSLILLLGLVLNVIPLRAATVTLYSGDDPLAYEGYARNILFHGLLMPNGADIGHGVPYYYYPLYSYAIAATHVILGEEFSAVVFLNVLAVSLVGLLAWYLAWRRLPEWTAAAGAAALTLFTGYHLLPYTITAYADSLFICLVFGALLASERALARDTAGWWIAAGVAGAAAAATRPSFLTHAGVWPVTVLLLGQGLFRHRAKRAGIFSLGFLLGLAPFAVRNFLMSGRLVLLVNSWIQIPYFLYPWDGPNRARQVDSLAEALQQAFQILVAHPGMVIELELRKLAFSLGLTQMGPENVGAHHLLLVGFIAFAIALVRRRIPSPQAMVLGAFVVSHAAAMVLAAPWTYGYKSILPLHAVFLVGAVHLLPSGRTAEPTPSEQVHGVQGGPGRSWGRRD